jgi:putative CocE/NonD family hydrolase
MSCASRRFTLALPLLIACVFGPSVSGAQDFGFEPPAEATDPALPEAMRDLAERLLPGYQEVEPDRYFSTLAALQMVVGNPAAAHTTRMTLRERLASEQSSLPPGRVVVFDIYTYARAIEAAEDVPFTNAYGRAFRETFGSLDDLAAYKLEDWLVAPVAPLRDAVQRALDRQRGMNVIALEPALELVQAWFAFDAYRNFAGLVRPLLAEDKGNRYIVEAVAVPVAQAATVQATLVRPRNVADAGTLPTLLEFTLDASSRDAYEAAAHGYASLLALARIAGDAASRPRAPFESDGDDARAVIAWIAAQPWSDGAVGMQGARYGGFAAWSAAKRLPPALKAIATTDPLAPGIDVPNVNRIFLNSAYRWVYELLAPPGDALVGDDARWRALSEEWYRAGKSYREFPSLPGRASAIFRSWLNHPSYDRFWQKWLPFGEELAGIGIPILTITGYYSPGETAALYYFAQHHQHHANADHALLIGPFDAPAVEPGASGELSSLNVDPVARIDLNDVRYAWFDHVLRGGDLPAVVSGEVNFELAQANEWRHAASLAALESAPLRFYVAAAPPDEPQRLVPQKSAVPIAIVDTRDLRDRSDAEWRPTEELVLEELSPRNGLEFVTDPFEEPVALVGRLRGELDFTVNKYDVDLVMMLYEVRADGRYVKLFDPAYSFRLSYAGDRVHRRLLLAGLRQQLPFQSERMLGRRLEAGSRLLLTIGVNQRADQQINYGASGDVSEESIEDAGAPVRIRWHEGTFIEVHRDDRAPAQSAAR